MNIRNVQTVVDARGRKAGVMLDIREYRRVLEALDELDAIRAYDRAKKSKGKPVPLARALAEARGRA